MLRCLSPLLVALTLAPPTAALARSDHHRVNVTMTAERKAPGQSTSKTATPTAPARPSQDTEAAGAYVAGALLSIFYHELGHALIDTMDIPVFAREEDVADSLAAWLTHELWTEEAARANAHGWALSWLISAEERDEEDLDLAGVHALDLQRFYNAVCLFYGGDPARRKDFAEEMELPADRAETCAEEASRSHRAWAASLGPLRDRPAPGPGKGLIWKGASRPGPFADLVAQEVKDLNAFMTLPVPVTVEIGPCDEPNAWYDPEARAITLCQEYIEDLQRQARAWEF